MHFCTPICLSATTFEQNFSILSEFWVGELLMQLHKSLYGLRQAPKQWYEALSTSLCKISFRRSICNGRLLIGETTSCPMYVVAYVDGMFPSLVPNQTSPPQRRSLQTYLETLTSGVHFRPSNQDRATSRRVVSVSVHVHTKNL